MPKLILGLGAYRRTIAGAPEIQLVNRYVERAPSNPDEQTTLISRPGTDLLASFGMGAIRGLFSKEGFASSALYVVSGTSLYKHTTAGVSSQITGTVGNTFRPRVAWMNGPAYAYMFIADGAGLQYTDGTAALATVALPSDIEGGALATLGGYVLVSGSSNKFYYIEPGEVTIGSNAYFTKEAQPDGIVDFVVVGDTVFILGRRSSEAWYATGDATSPFAPVKGQAYSRGARQGTAAVIKEFVALVGDDGVVYRLGGGVTRISDHGIEERIRKEGLSADVLLTGWSFSLDGHSFYVLELPTQGTFVYDFVTEQWAHFRTHGTHWNVQDGHMWGSRIIGGDLFEPKVWEVLPTVLTDDGDAETPIEHVTTGIVPRRERAEVAVAALRVTAGASLGGATSVMQLRFSDDNGLSWSDYFDVDLVDGSYSEIAYRSLGAFGAPGRIFELSDNGGPLRIDGADLDIH